ncbi:MAG: alpha/beta hydrolase [Dehalococcoidaceae bacterium]|nr:alpha/beta hydrolase [Dehalococcoidaceae bacterium]
MPLTNNDVQLYYEVTGSGVPVVFVHEFAGEHTSWTNQVEFFSKKFQVITFNARGYPPSDVPESEKSYSQDIAVQDILSILDELNIEKAHIVGLSMGGYATLLFGIQFPERCLSITVAGVGYGSTKDRSNFEKDAEHVANRILQEGIEKFGDIYTVSATRVQLQNKDRKAWEEFKRLFQNSSSLGHANTMLGVQRNRPSILSLEKEMKKINTPTLIITGDEDEPCLEPSIFMKRCIPTSGLFIVPNTGHTVNLEEPDLFNQMIENFLNHVANGTWPSRDPRSWSKSALLPDKEENE